MHTHTGLIRRNALVVMGNSPRRLGRLPEGHGCTTAPIPSPFHPPSLMSAAWTSLHSEAQRRGGGRGEGEGGGGGVTHLHLVQTPASNNRQEQHLTYFASLLCRSCCPGREIQGHRRSVVSHWGSKAAVMVTTCMYQLVGSRHCGSRGCECYRKKEDH